MEEIFARPDGETSSSSNAEAGSSGGAAQPAGQARPTSMTPFAIVSSVAPSSPSFEAGLLASDEIVHFGSITSLNHKNLSAVGEAVRDAERGGEEVQVVVFRGEEEGRREMKVLRLRPRSGWGGRGSLGCGFVRLGPKMRADPALDVDATSCRYRDPLTLHSCSPVCPCVYCNIVANPTTSRAAMADLDWSSLYFRLLSRRFASSPFFRIKLFRADIPILTLSRRLFFHESANPLPKSVSLMASARERKPGGLHNA